MTDQIKSIYFGNLTAKRGKDGFMYVKGLASDDTLDLDQQICDPQWLKSALPDWFAVGNIREMHQAKAIGKATEMEQTGTGFVVTAKIVDEQAAKMVEEGVYTGFSVGIKGARVVKDAAAPGGRITDGTVVELSLVDRPANPSCVIEIAKSVDGVLVKGSAVDEKFATGTDINTDAEMSSAPVIIEEADLEPRSVAYQPCSQCGGSGHKSNVDAEALTEIRCERCNGSGKEPEGEHEQIQQDSPSNPGIADDINHEIKSAVAEAVAEAMKSLKPGVVTVGDLKDAITKAAETEHDPAQLEAVRANLIALIKAELDEILSGEANEIADVRDLLVSLSLFLNWWDAEADENETAEPFAEAPAFVGLGASADIIKTVVAEIAADEKTDLRDELRKALGMDEEIATTKAALAEARESVDTLKAALDEIREMAAPGGPVLRQTQVQSNKSARVTALNVEAERLRMTASQLQDPSLRNQYLTRANQLDAEAETL